MKLGEWLKKYRTAHNMSMQDMADKCGFSKAYISLLEKGVNPATKKPFSPTIQTFEKIARATEQDVDSLIKILDGEQPVTINSNVAIDGEGAELLKGFYSLSPVGKNMLLGVLSSLRVTHAAAL